MLSVDRQAAETIRFGEPGVPARKRRQGAPAQRLLPPGRATSGEQLDYDESRAFEENADRGKHRDLQGPIDDAFTAPVPLRPRHRHALEPRRSRRGPTPASKQFADDWRHYLRGELRIKNDTEVTADDIETTTSSSSATPARTACSPAS